MKLTRNLLNLTKMKPRKIKNVFDAALPESVVKASKLLEKGTVIGIPTDTIYGLACSANNQVAIKKLYDIKGRNEEKPVAICVSDFTELKRYGNANHLSDKLLEKLLPGPVTIVLNKSEHLTNPYLNPGTQKIGIRIPDFNFIRDVCREFSQPIALTSANKSSERSSLNIEEFNHLWKSLGGVFDGGSLSNSEENRKGSTVIDLSEPNEYRVIRQGIAYEETIKSIEEHGFREVL